MTQVQPKLITVTTSAGKRLQAFEGDEITRQILQNGEYDAWALASLREVLQYVRPRTSLDIGANIGNHAVVIGELSQRLFAFEPLPFVYQVLQHNLARNLGERARGFNLALSDIDAAVRIGVRSEENFGASSLCAGSSDGETVRAVVGDEFLAEQGIAEVDFIKIDVEGHEASALSGLTKTILRDQPLVMMEWNDAETAAGFARLRLFDTVFAGYQPFAVSRTDSTKLHPHTLAGRLRRLRYRLFDRTWCLTDFDPVRKYSNVYLVPPRMAEELAALRYLPAPGA